MIGEKNTDDVRIKEVHVVLPPVAIREKYPLTEKAADTVINARKEIQNIMDDRDDRLVVVTGPCSIHDPKSAIEYANRLAVLREKYKDTLHIIMRVYFEKPRTTVGWKGLINDPYLDHSYKINDGLRIGRKLMLDVNNLGVPGVRSALEQLNHSSTEKWLQVCHVR